MKYRHIHKVTFVLRLIRVDLNGILTWEHNRSYQQRFIFMNHAVDFYSLDRAFS